MLNKKAAIKQVFTFLMVAILIGLVFLFGIKSMEGIANDTCQADRALFIKQIGEFVDKYNAYGSVREENMILPCGYEQVCFVASDKAGIGGSATTDNNMFNQMVANDKNNNMFLLKKNEADPIGFSLKISIEGGGLYSCPTIIGNKAKIRFVGEGRTTAIGLPS